MTGLALEILVGFMCGLGIGLVPGVVVAVRNRAARRELLRRWERDRDYFNRTTIYQHPRSIR